MPLLAAACILSTALGESTQPAAAPAPAAPSCLPVRLPPASLVPSALPASCPAHPRPQAKAAGGSHPKVKFNRLLLRFGSLHEGFAACRKVFAQWAGSDEGELSEARLRDACSTLGYTLDAATLDKIFVSADMDASNTLNQHEFLVVLAILHILKVRVVLLGWPALHCCPALQRAALRAALHCCTALLSVYVCVASDDAVARVALAQASRSSVACASALDCAPTCTRPPNPCLPASPTLQGPEDVERVNPVILRSLQTAEEAFMSFDSSAKGHIDKGELMGMMHEVGRAQPAEKLIYRVFLLGASGGEHKATAVSLCTCLYTLRLPPTHATPRPPKCRAAPTTCGTLRGAPGGTPSAASRRSALLSWTRMAAGGSAS